MTVQDYNLLVEIEQTMADLQLSIDMDIERMLFRVVDKNKIILYNCTNIEMVPAFISGFSIGKNYRAEDEVVESQDCQS